MKMRIADHISPRAGRSEQREVGSARQCQHGEHFAQALYCWSCRFPRQHWPNWSGATPHGTWWCVGKPNNPTPCIKNTTTASRPARPAPMSVSIAPPPVWARSMRDRWPTASNWTVIARISAGWPLPSWRAPMASSAIESPIAFAPFAPRSAMSAPRSAASTTMNIASVALKPARPAPKPVAKWVSLNSPTTEPDRQRAPVGHRQERYGINTQQS